MKGLIWEMGEPVGLITYMRTDSVHVSELAQKRSPHLYYRNPWRRLRPPKKFLNSRPNPRVPQEAHEAVRPTSTLRTPKEMKSLLTRDQYRPLSIDLESFCCFSNEPSRL